MFEQRDDHEPWFHLRGYPLYATHAIVLVYVVSMLLCTLAGMQGAGALASLLGFDSARVFQGQVWRIFTYGLVNPPSFWFAIDMVMLVWFGREVEKFFGRRVFLKFYAGIYLLTPVLLLLFGFVTRTSHVGETGGLAMFIAFATLYPAAQMMFGLSAAMWAIALLGINTLVIIYGRSLFGLVSLWVPAVFAFAFVRYEQGRFELPSIRVPSFGKRPKLRVLPKPDPDDDEIDEPMAEVDALLDKIAKSGIGSLTAKERERLEKARAELLRRESR